MTTPTHSHKAWTDKGGHVKVTEGDLCQPTSKTGPAPTPKVSHPEAMREPLPAALAAGHGSPLQGSSAAEKRSTAGVGFGLAKTGNAHTAGGWSRWRA